MWKSVRAPSPAAKAARLNAHYASQLAAAVGKTLATPRDDDSHTALSWDFATATLASVVIPDSGVRVALRVASLELLVLDGGEVRTTIPLIGQTMEQGLAALSAAIDAPHDLERPTYDMPEHPLATGAAFEVDSAELGALEQWFENAADVLRQISRDEEKATPVRLWPHHFDIATLVAIDEGVDAEKARSIGVGLSPGDETYDEPYWYVAPWPYPDADPKFQVLPIGEWRTEGFYAAILTASQLVATGSNGQAERAIDFIESAIGSCRRLLGVAETSKPAARLV